MKTLKKCETLKQLTVQVLLEVVEQVEDTVLNIEFGSFRKVRYILMN